jgi:DNA polymerase II large subunit
VPFSASATWQETRKLATFPEHLAQYYLDILAQYELAYKTAEDARSKGLDPNDYVESKTVLDLADRVNQMLGLDQFEGLVLRLRELLKSTTKERSALTIAQEIALGKFGMMTIEKALEYGVRAGLAVITDSVTVAPIQGIYTVTINKNDDNSSYASISYAGPMRSAGGTEAAFSLIIADAVAKKLGLSNYRAREEEVGRYIEELRVYEREVGNFQYRVSDDDVRAAITNIPVEINGVETDPVEVVVHRGLTRVATNRLRGGALRVLNDGVIGRAHKLAKILADLNIQGWEWLTQLKGGNQQSSEETEKTGAHFEEVISGRAVLSSHNAKGGFRIRYGRSFNTGLSTIGIHPAVPTLLDYPVVVGTQVKVDLPGKAATIAFVDTIEGPTVLLKDGSLKKIGTTKEAEVVYTHLSKIVDLGDALISFGDFLENNKELSPSPYVEEWWVQDIQEAISSNPKALDELVKKGLGEQRISEIVNMKGKTISAEEALAICEATTVPLHPRYTYRFDKVDVSTLLDLRNRMKLSGYKVTLDLKTHNVRSALEELLLPFEVQEGFAVISSESSVIITRLLRLGQEITKTHFENPFDLIEQLSGIKLQKQTTSTVGVRVGRPEKAMLRHLKPPVHLLFPVGSAGGHTRDLNVAAKSDAITIDIANIICPSCKKRRLTTKCEECAEATTRYVTCPRCYQIINQSSNQSCPNCKLQGVTHSPHTFELKSKLDYALKVAGGSTQRPIKGVRGLTSESKIVEPVEKGVLRSKHAIYVYKDGTTRIDLTNAPLTHFRPRDIQVDLEKLHRIGYDTDIHGKPITSTDQVTELKPQDIVIPKDIAEDLVNASHFVDDELSMFYGEAPAYKMNSVNDLVGKIVLGLAPHTSVAVVARIIGFTNAQVCFANPCWHASKRRDCDGDGDSLLLLLDVFLNFSTEYLPDKIGGLMDTPLLIQPIVLPSEVDDQAHNFDVASFYPRQFYLATQKSPNPSSLKLLIDTIGKRLNSDKQFYDYGFTNDTQTITIKHSRSAYPTLKTLAEKVSKQIEVAEKIQAVSTKEVVESIIKTHLLRDIIGNMKKYSTQSFKCRGCGRTFRRPSVSGKCDFCKQELHETLSRASVEKYLALAQRLAHDYQVDEYIKGRLELAVRELDQLFQKRDKSTQLELTDFATH